MIKALPVAILALFLSIPAIAFSSAPERLSDYDIIWRGFHIGSGKIRIRDAGDGKVSFRSEIHVSAGLLSFKHTIDCVESALVGPTGTVSYRRASTENGTKTVSEGSFTNGAFQMTVTTGGKTAQLTFPRTTFDATTMDCPETAMGPGKKEMTLRVLDLEKAKIVTRTYRWIGNENVAVADKVFQSSVVDFQDEGKKGRRWLQSHEAVPLILRQDGKGTDGAYTFVIKGVREPGARQKPAE